MAVCVCITRGLLQVISVPALSPGDAAGASVPLVSNPALLNPSANPSTIQASAAHPAASPQTCQASAPAGTHDCCVRPCGKTGWQGSAG